MQIDIIESKWNSSARHGWWCQLPGKPIKYPYPSGLHFTRHPPPMNITVIINTTNMSVFRFGKPTEDQRNHRAKLCAMAWAMATTGSGIFSNKGCEQACKNYILKQLGLFPGIDIIVYWVLKIQFWNTADPHLVPFINIIKYQFHAIPTSTSFALFRIAWSPPGIGFRMKLTMQPDYRWLLGHLDLWGIFLLTPRCSSISHALLMNIAFSGPRLIWMPPCYYHLHASRSAPATKHWAQHKRKLDCSNWGHRETLVWPSYLGFSKTTSNRNHVPPGISCNRQKPPSGSTSPAQHLYIVFDVLRSYSRMIVFHHAVDLQTPTAFGASKNDYERRASRNCDTLAVGKCPSASWRSKPFTCAESSICKPVFDLLIFLEKYLLLIGTMENSLITVYVKHW